MARFKKCAEPEEEVAEVEHPGQMSFVAFMRHVRPDLQITPQVELLAHLVEGPLLRGEGWLRLVLVWPPGTGKTWAGKLLLAWVFGLYPSWHILTLCLSVDLAKDIGAEVRNLIATREFAEVFPHTKVAKDSSAKQHFEIVDRSATARGEFNAAGRSTRFTGRRGKFLHFDDLIAEKEADSAAAILDAQNTISAAYSRGHPAGYHWLINNTRYREDDPVGHVLDKYSHEGPWTVVHLPAIAEAEQQYPNGWVRPVGHVLPFYTKENLDKKRLTYEKNGRLHEWFGQFCGLPRPPGGRKVNPADIMRYAEAVSAMRARCDRVTVIVDTAKRDQEQNDPSAVLCIGQIGERHYVLDALVERLLLPFLEVALARFCLLWKPHKCLIELTANGEALRDGLEKRGYAIDITKPGHERVPWRTPIEGVEVAGQGSKVLRFEAVVPGAVKRGALWVPESAPWAGAYVSELANFPKGHDDQCDATAIYFKWVDENDAVLQNARPAIPAAVLAAASPAGGISRSGVGPFGHAKRW